LRLRLPIQRMVVPVKVMVAVAPAVDDCMAEPPLQPKVAGLCVQPALKVTPTFSSTRLWRGDGSDTCVTRTCAGSNVSEACPGPVVV
jgi:hypothetical protein